MNNPIKINWDDWDIIEYEEEEDEDYFEGHEDFKEFLIEENILDDYISVFERYNYLGQYDDLKEFLDVKKYNLYLYVYIGENAFYRLNLRKRWLKYRKEYRFKKFIDKMRKILIPPVHFP